MTDTDLQSLAADVERDIQGYNSAFIRANLEANPSLMRPWMRLPVSIFGNGSVAMLETPEDVDAQYARGVEGLKGTGYVRSILSDFSIRLMNPTTALVECRAVRERNDGSVIAAFDACYIMARSDDRWQVASLISRR